jgi:hypothetical protein
MKAFFSRLTRQPFVVLASWFIFVMFTVIVLPAVAFNAVEMGLTQSIDTNFNFNPELIYSIIESYGETGRAFYLWQRWTFDLIWPMIYGLPLWLTLQLFLPMIKANQFKGLVWLPLFAILFDYLENIIFTIVVISYPSNLIFLTYFGVFLSLLKWLSLTFAMGLTMVVSVIVGGQYLLKQFAKKSS